MKKVIVALALSASVGAIAKEQVEYSVEGFCNLQNKLEHSIQQKRYLKAYSEKLGFTPDRQDCQNIKVLNNIAFKPHENDWNYFMNKPYRGSVIRLSDNQISKLRAAKVSSKDFNDIVATVD